VDCCLKGNLLWCILEQEGFGIASNCSSTGWDMIFFWLENSKIFSRCGILHNTLYIFCFSIYLTPCFSLQGYLDEQFSQLEELQDDSSPNFVEEVVALFFKDSSRLMANIEQAL
jgi:hypothetical protein